MTGKEEKPYKITYSKEAKEYIEKQKVEKYLDEFQYFFPRKMINLYHNQFNDFIIDKMSVSVEMRTDVQIDERILNKWVDMCIKLDSMSKEQIEDIAIRHYIEKLENKHERELTKYKRAFEILKDEFGLEIKECCDKYKKAFKKDYQITSYSHRVFVTKEEAELLEELMKDE